MLDAGVLRTIHSGSPVVIGSETTAVRNNGLAKSTRRACPPDDAHRQGNDWCGDKPKLTAGAPG